MLIALLVYLLVTVPLVFGFILGLVKPEPGDWGEVTILFGITLVWPLSLLVWIGAAIGSVWQ